MSNVRADRFHQLFPDHGEPKLPISIYNMLLDIVEEDKAFELLCNYERGFITMSDIASAMAAG